METKGSGGVAHVETREQSSTLSRYSRIHFLTSVDPMPRNPQSERRKEHIVSLLQKHLGPLCQHHQRRSDWYSSEDGTVDVFITDSKSTYNQRPWFDMRYD